MIRTARYIFLCALAAGIPLQASFLYSNCSTNCTGFDSGAALQWSGDTEVWAMQFTLASSGFLSDVQLALADGGSTSDNYAIKIAADASGNPGTVLDSMPLTGVPNAPGSVEANSVSNPFLTAGTTYWFEVTALSPGASTSWYVADQPVSGGAETLSSDGGSTWNAPNFTSTQSAFELDGGVPEPAAWTFTIGGLLALAAWRRRRAS
ncbi:MAG TPA: choice-of-anchor R domain-containing protein [Bryobacteraceae bacterium]|nr:choice-of-anchor R domain-containing protein [Bryobacteraceae bacterium]